MSKWYPVNKPIRDFELKVGMVFEVDEAGNGLVQYLVGDVNDSGGTCNCCSRPYDTNNVIRYRMINWEKP